MINASIKKIGVINMKHIKTITKNKLQNVKLNARCGECQTSCQSACKTSCTVANQSGEKM